MSPIIASFSSGTSFSRKGAAKVGPPLTFETINLTGGGNFTFTGNGSSTINAWKNTGSNGWDTKVYSTNTWAPPATIEYQKNAAENDTDNGASYGMISFNTDPTTNNSYSSLDLASYPYYYPSWYGYDNGSFYQGNSGNTMTWRNTDKFYLVYKPDGTIEHWYGTKLIHSQLYHTGASKPNVHLDMAFYVANATFCQFYNVRVCNFIWDGVGINGLPPGYYDANGLRCTGQ